MSIRDMTVSDVARLAGVEASPVAVAGESQPTAAVRTVYPPGMGPLDTDDGQDVITYLAGAGAIAVVGGAAFIAVRRRARPERAA